MARTKISRIGTAVGGSSRVRNAEDRRQAILDVAETMFSENGIAAISVRSILMAAGANVAAVHYHFGSKESLIEAVFRRRADQIAQQRISNLRRALADPDETYRLERIIRAFLEAGFTNEEPEAAKRFAKLRARVSSDDTEHANRLAAGCFNESSQEFLRAFHEVLPRLTETEIAWRFHATLGVMMYTSANPTRIKILTGGVCDPSDYLEAVEHLIPLIAAMFRAPSKATSVNATHGEEITQTTNLSGRQTDERPEDTVTGGSPKSGRRI